MADLVTEYFAWEVTRDAAMGDSRLFFYARPSGSQPVRDFLDDLHRRNKKAFVKALAVLERLQSDGIGLDSGFVKKARGDVWELRIDYAGMFHRIYFGLLPGAGYILAEAVSKKQNKASMDDIQRAQSRIEEARRTLYKTESRK
jgi:phage-related protein